MKLRRKGLPRENKNSHGLQETTKCRGTWGLREDHLYHFPGYLRTVCQCSLRLKEVVWHVSITVLITNSHRKRYWHNTGTAQRIIRSGVFVHVPCSSQNTAYIVLV